MDPPQVCTVARKTPTAIVCPQTITDRRCRMRWYSRWVRLIPSRPRAKSRRHLRIETLESRAMPHVSGTVFLDANGNGIRDAGDAGIADVAVQLFKGDT